MNLIFFLCVYICTTTAQQVITVKNAPVVTNVDEGLETESKLGSIECETTPADPNFKYKVTLNSVTPLLNCGGTGQCFSIRADNDESQQPIYNIFHYPFANNRLRYSDANSYTLSITCEDQNGVQSVPGQIAEVRLIPNMEPIFVTRTGESVTFSASDLTAGALIFTVSAQDPENNDLTYRLLNPDGKFELDARTGQIRVLEGFEGLCTGATKFSFEVTVQDPYHDELTPINIDLNVDYPARPTLVGANQQITVSEAAPVGLFFHSFSVFDGTLAIDVENPIVPASIASKFSLQSDVLRITEQFNFEEASMGNISFVVSNGVCRELYFLVINVKNENDPPTLFPKIQTGIVDEGLIRYDMQSFVDDEDIQDTHTYRIVKASIGTNIISDRFTIDNNGLITSTGDFDLDGPNLDTQTVVFDIEVTDPGGLTDTGQVTMIINNANDNRPVISTTSIYNDMIMDCSLPMRIGEIAATDKDFGTNGDIIFTARSDGPLSVSADGSIFLISQIAAGSTHQLVVNAEDLGNPPQESSVPVTITVVGQPCTTTTTTTTPAPPVVVNNTNVNNNTNINMNSNVNINTVAMTQAPVVSTGILDDPNNLIWIILLAILGLLLLLLLLYLLWRFCFPLCCPGVCGIREPSASGPCGTESACGKCCDCCRKEPPREPRVRGKGDIHDFWQEHYQEQDYNSTGHRHRAPNAATHELGYLRPN